MFRLLPYLVALISFLGVEAALIRPIFFLSGFAITLAAAAYATAFLYRFKWSKKLSAILISEALLIVSNFAFLLFTERMLPRHIMAATLAVLLLLIIEQLRFLSSAPDQLREGSLSGLILLSYAATMFWAGAALYGLRFFFYLPLTLLAAIVFAAALFFNYALFINLTPQISDIRFRAFITAGFALELFLAVYFSPSTLAVSGALFAIPLAVFMNIYRLRLEERLEKKTILRNVIFGALALIAVIATAEWS